MLRRTTLIHFPLSTHTQSHMHVLHAFCLQISANAMDPSYGAQRSTCICTSGVDGRRQHAPCPMGRDRRRILRPLRVPFKLNAGCKSHMHCWDCICDNIKLYDISQQNTVRLALRFPRCTSSSPDVEIYRKTVILLHFLR